LPFYKNQERIKNQEKNQEQRDKNQKNKTLSKTSSGKVLNIGEPFIAVLVKPA